MIKRERLQEYLTLIWLETRGHLLGRISRDERYRWFWHSLQVL